MIRTVLSSANLLVASETYLDLMRDVPHWCFELTVEVVSGVAAFPLARRLWRFALRRHDEQEHAPDLEDLLQINTFLIRRIESLEAWEEEAYERLQALEHTQEVDE